MPARTLEQLAAQVGRPPTALPAFGRLSPDEIELLSRAIEAAEVAYREELDAAFAKAIPSLPGSAARTILRSRAP